MGVPRPAGSPAPSGPMLISQGAISAGAIDWPNCGTCAGAGAATTMAAQSARPLIKSRRFFVTPAEAGVQGRRSSLALSSRFRGNDDFIRSDRALRIDIGRLALFVDAPARNRIVVVDPTQAALGSECCACRLHHAGVIGGAALQHRAAASPLPRRAEAHWRLGQDWTLQGGGCPALPTIRGHLDLPDAPIARPR